MTMTSRFSPCPSRSGGPLHPRANRVSAFTLLELLVSMAILALIVVLVAQLVNGASATSKLQTQRLDVDGQARMIFDRMAMDFAGMVRRPDMDSTAYKYPNFRGSAEEFKRPGNDGFLFFSQALSMGVGATQSQDTVSLVGYRIYQPTGDDENAFKLDRLGQGAEWSGSGSSGTNPALPFLSFPNPIVPGETSGFNIDEKASITKYWPELGGFSDPGSMTPHTGSSPFHVLSRDAFRLEFALLMDKTSDNTDANGFLKQDYLDFAVDQERAFKGVQAIVVTIALLDSASRTRLGDNASSVLKDVASKLEDDYTGDAAAKWTEVLQSPSTPPLVSANARVYQRYFYLK